MERPITQLAPCGLVIVVVAMAASRPAPAAEYVVNAAHPQASDLNPGTEALPWKTIGRGAAAAYPGDVVRVLPGVYAAPLRPLRSGTAEAPITFLGVADGEARAVIEGGDPSVDLRNLSYIRVEGFEIRNATGSGVLMHDGDHLELVGNHIHHTAGTGVIIDRGTDCLLDANYVHDLGGQGIKGGGWTYRLTRCTLSRNRIHTNQVEDGIQLGSGDDVVIRHNYIHDIQSPPPSHTDGIEIHSDNHGYTILGNVLHNIRSEALMIEGNDRTGWGRPLVEGNIISDGGGVPLQLSWTSHMAPEDSAYRESIARHNTVIGGRYNGIKIGSPAYSATAVANILDCPEGPVRSYVTEPAYTPIVDYNLSPVRRWTTGPHFIQADPMFVDPKAPGSELPPNLRLRPGSPAIDAGPDGSDIGALAYPNVYVVDAAHAGASDAFYGYPGLPFKTLGRAVQVAAPGETIIVRGGVYRETVRPTVDDLTIRAADGDDVFISGADRVVGWTRQGEEWSAPLATEPEIVLRDGEQLEAFTYDADNARLIVSGFDPRLHPIEVVVRLEGVDLSQTSGTTVDGLRVIDTLNDWEPLKIRGRRTFYNNSAFDGYDAAANAADDAAIATDKLALRPGQTAGWANYTAYARGINGIMVDIVDLPGAFDAGELVFRAGRLGDPATWPAIEPSEVAVRRGAGTAGSDRVTAVFPDGAVTGCWLQVTVTAGPGTGLETPEVFYVGNAVGETGDAPGEDTAVGIFDAWRCQSNPAGLDLDDFAVLKRHFGAAVSAGSGGDYDLDGDVDLDDFAILKEAFGTTAAVDSPFDINRDRRVNSDDVDLVVEHWTGTHHPLLPLITAP
ncbi:MAG: right-handed parallel beta-helix repeat-containing protein [Planctomycetota bacterium]